MSTRLRDITSIELALALCAMTLFYSIFGIVHIEAGYEIRATILTFMGVISFLLALVTAFHRGVLYLRNKM